MGQIESSYRLFDSLLVLDSGAGGAITATGTATTAFIDLGSARVRGEAVIDISALKTSAGNESYKIVLQGGTESGFSSGSEEELMTLAVGHASVKDSDQTDAAPVRFVVPFDTHRTGTVYRYVRLRAVLSGTAPSITLGESYLTRSK